jgi:hypothetical protein
MIMYAIDLQQAHMYCTIRQKSVLVSCLCMPLTYSKLTCIVSTLILYLLWHVSILPTFLTRTLLGIELENVCLSFDSTIYTFQLSGMS